jgi:hypothetical protein
MAIQIDDLVIVTIERHPRYKQTGRVLSLIKRCHPNFSRAEIEFPDSEIVQIELRGLQPVSSEDGE